MTDSTTLKAKIQRTLRLDLALRFIWQSTPSLTIANVALILVQGPLPLLSLYLMKRFVDTVTEGLATHNLDAAFHDVAMVIVYMGAVALFGAAIGALAGLLSQRQALVVTDYMQRVIHAKSIEMDLEFYENPEYYDTLRRAQHEAPSRPLHVLQGLIELGKSSVSLVAIAGLLLSLHWLIVALLALTVVPSLLVRLRYSGKLYRWQRRRTETERRAWYFEWLLVGEYHAKELRLFDLGPLFVGRYQALRQQLRREQLQLSTQQALIGLAVQLFTTVAIYGSYSFIGYRTLQGAIGLGDLVMYFQAFQRGQGFLQQVSSSLAGLYEDTLFLTNLYEFLNLKPKIVNSPTPRSLPCPLQTGIVLEHVTFQYPGSSQPALEDISLTIKPGEHIALVGENGSGKTTLAKLLCRLYDPTEGRITLDGVDVRDLDIQALRASISVIFQDYARYNLSVEENIWFGDVHTPLDPEQIAHAAHHAGIDGRITQLKDGYHTILGRQFQDGEQLSIGEWQKIALARAFLRDAQLTILDEPTSAMDARAEFEIFSQFHHLAQGRATVTISHRFSTVRSADCIYVLEHGRIIEQGSHGSLIERNGTYASLFRTQARYYVE